MSDPEDIDANEPEAQAAAGADDDDDRGRDEVSDPSAGRRDGTARSDDEEERREVAEDDGRVSDRATAREEQRAHAGGGDEDDEDDEREHEEHDDDEDEPHGGRGRRRRPDSLFRETLRRAVEKGLETGVGTFTKADSAFRGVVDEVKLPREVASLLFSQVDETKNALVKGVAREVRDFLEATDIANEFYRALTSLSFEIKTEIRFIPNDSGGVKPEVKAKVAPKRDKRRRRKRGGSGEEDSGDSES